jgi:hypothetical protein
MIVINAVAAVAISLTSGGTMLLAYAPEAEIVVDRSFYQEPAEDEWPGNHLSDRQYEDAVRHFADRDACKQPAKWALIGPQNFLLEGTRYQVRSGSYGSFYIRGYWGGHEAWPSTIAGNMAAAEGAQARICKYGDVP